MNLERLPISVILSFCLHAASLGAIFLLMREGPKQHLHLVKGVELLFRPPTSRLRAGQAAPARRRRSDLRELSTRGRGTPGGSVSRYRKAAEQGSADAQLSLGGMLYLGYGVAQDYEEAVSWYRKAAEQGNVYAQSNLGTMYHRGHGVAQDHGEAASWYRKAAEQGYADAQYALGKMYSVGQGVARNYGLAVSWLHKAAEQGHADAQYLLGKMYSLGLGVVKDRREAVSWYRKAAKQGHAAAQVDLLGSEASPDSK